MLATNPIADIRALFALENTSTAESLRDAARRGGAEYAVSVSGFSQARRVLVDEKITFLVVEDRLDGEMGLELVHRVRRGQGVMAYVPIIMALHSPTRDKVMAARNAGVNRVVGMPLSANDALTHIRQTWTNMAPFVNCDAYFGPCRRWHNEGPEERERRRHQQGLISPDRVRAALARYARTL
ncbi:hypothetical protein [Yunchengibacter salinarum]|uniref:hypothetical protein n=1 Tax=Yunchengibacter salinarum TaxID=3133399 RepID=UPI0035B6387E